MAKATTITAAMLLAIAIPLAYWGYWWSESPTHQYADLSALRASLGPNCDTSWGGLPASSHAIHLQREFDTDSAVLAVSFDLADNCPWSPEFRPIDAREIDGQWLTLPVFAWRWWPASLRGRLTQASLVNVGLMYFTYDTPYMQQRSRMDGTFASEWVSTTMRVYWAIDCRSRKAFAWRSPPSSPRSINLRTPNP